MKELRWNLLKNERLIKTRGVSFDELVNSKLINILRHPIKENQKIMLFEYKKYIWVVPFVEEENYYFLKTLYPSRKYTKIFKGANK
ncbi:MAG: toxin [Elusimicrobia bacterium]|nr:toxin [Candidatus Liberimonas magnetica]